LKIVCLIVVLLGIATMPSFAEEAHLSRGARAAASIGNVGTSAGKKSTARHRPEAGMRGPVARDSIGRAVVRPEITPAVGAERVVPPSRLPATAVIPGPNKPNQPGLPKSLAIAPHISAQPLHPVGSASTANGGRIGGTGMIRQRLAPAAIGGPTKTSGGIDGTTFRPKH
jgi:hypothetical protein